MQDSLFAINFLYVLKGMTMKKQKAHRQTPPFYVSDCGGVKFHQKVVPPEPVPLRKVSSFWVMMTVPPLMAAT
jgi:hypothetical protein